MEVKFLAHGSLNLRTCCLYHKTYMLLWEIHIIYLSHKDQSALMNSGYWSSSEHCHNIKVYCFLISRNQFSKEDATDLSVRCLLYPQDQEKFLCRYANKKCACGILNLWISLQNSCSICLLIWLMMSIIKYCYIGTNWLITSFHYIW